MRKRIFALLLAMILGVGCALADADVKHAPTRPQPLDISLEEFLGQYNGQVGVEDPIGETIDLETQLAGVIYMPANDVIDLFVQVSYDQRKGAVQYVGAVMQCMKDQEPDFEGFVEVCVRLMRIVFPEMEEKERRLMLVDAIYDGVLSGAFENDEGHVKYQVGECVLNYYLSLDGERQVLMYRLADA